MDKNVGALMRSLNAENVGTKYWKKQQRCVNHGADVVKISLCCVIGLITSDNLLILNFGTQSLT